MTSNLVVRNDSTVLAACFSLQLLCKKKTKNPPKCIECAQCTKPETQMLKVYLSYNNIKAEINMLQLLVSMAILWSQKIITGMCSAAQLVVVLQDI